MFKILLIFFIAITHQSFSLFKEELDYRDGPRGKQKILRQKHLKKIAEIQKRRLEKNRLVAYNKYMLMHQFYQNRLKKTRRQVV